MLKRNLAAMAAIAVIIGCAYLLSGDSSDQKIISVYSPVANYSLPVLQRDGRDYVGLLEILEPLGSVSSRVDKQVWRLRFNNTDSGFANGSNQGRIHGRDFDLTGRFFLENNRGLVPVDSLVTLLREFLGISVTFHANARRLFIRENGSTYSAQVIPGPPAKLVLNFGSPVNPKIATEPGKLRMTFIRDPIIGPGQESMTFNTAVISSANFAESNGAAELTIHGNVPLLASFSNDGRTITIAPAPSSAAAAQAAPPIAGTVPQTGATPPAAATPAPAQPTVSPAPTFAVIDPSHGGTETGAKFSATLVEKDVTLAFARQLRQEFQSKGLSAMLLRDGDTTLTSDQRANLTNRVRPAIYISLHAGSDGKGARICTALLSANAQDNGPFVNWDHAQAAFLGFSLTAAVSVAGELGKALPARTMPAALSPLSNIIVPAIAIEIAPRSGDLADLTASDYQQQVATAVVAGIAAVKDKLVANR